MALRWTDVDSKAGTIHVEGLWDMGHGPGETTDMGHSSASITLDRYGHLMPGNEAEAAELLDTYIAAGAG